METVHNTGMELFVWATLKVHELCVSWVILLCVCSVECQCQCNTDGVQ